MWWFSKFSRSEETVADLTLYAPISGNIVPIEDVPDIVFSEKIIGDGIAIKPTSDTVVSPCNGEVTLVADTKHAIGLKNEDGVEVLIHIGLDTVKLNGEGFEALCKVGDQVKVGAPLVKVDREFLKQKNTPDVTMMVVVEPNGHQISKYNINNSVEAGKDLLLEYE